MFQGCIEMNKLCERLHGLSTDSSMLGACETSWQRPLRSVSTGIPNGFEVENVTGSWGNLSCNVSIEPMSNVGFPTHQKRLIRRLWIICHHVRLNIHGCPRYFLGKFSCNGPTRGRFDRVSKPSTGPSAWARAARVTSHGKSGASIHLAKLIQLIYNSNTS